MEGAGEEGGEDGGGDGFFVVGDGQAAFGDVEDALGGAAVGFGIVEDAVVEPGGGEDGAFVFVGGGRQGEGAREAGAVEHEGGGGYVGDVAVLFEGGVEEVLDTLVDRAEVFGEDAVFFAAEGHEVFDEAGKRCGVVGVFGDGGGQADGGLAEFAELKVQVGEKARIAGIRQDREQGGGVFDFVVHGVE